MGDPLSVEARRTIGGRFARNLIAARNAAGLSQEMLGFGASLHRTEIGTLERGERVPRLDTLVKLAGVLNVSVGRLIDGIEWEAPDLGGGRFSVAQGQDDTSE